jgi:hypothetical protein
MTRKDSNGHTRMQESKRIDKVATSCHDPNVEKGKKKSRRRRACEKALWEEYNTVDGLNVKHQKIAAPTTIIDIALTHRITLPNHMTLL